MKYLIQNKKSLAITITALIVAIFDLFKVLTGVDLGFNEDQILAFVTVIIGVIVWWHNIPTSYTNHKLTVIMRKIKKMIKNGDHTLLDAIEHLIEEWGDEDGND